MVGQLGDLEATIPEAGQPFEHCPIHMRKCIHYEPLPDYWK